MSNYFVETKNENAVDMDGIEYLSKVVYRGKKEEVENAFSELKQKNQYGLLTGWEEGTMVRIVREDKGVAVVLSEFAVEHRGTKQTKIFSEIVRTLDALLKSEESLRMEFADTVVHDGVRAAVSRHMYDAIIAETRGRLIRCFLNLPRYMSIIEGMDDGVMRGDIGGEISHLVKDLERVLSSVSSDLLSASEISHRSTSAVSDLADQMSLRAKAGLYKEMNNFRNQLKNAM